MPIRIAINGAAGRVGRRLLAFAAADQDLQVAEALEFAQHPDLGKPVKTLVPETQAEICLASELTNAAQVLVDFSVPASTLQRCEQAARLGVGLVIGTTGLTAEEEQKVTEAAQRVPVIHAPNFSLGVNVLFRVAAEVARVLGEDYDIEITESHHNRKADAPSGTAIGLARAICEATDRDLQKDLVHGRSGRPGPRPRREIGMHALRMGSVVGEHTVHFGSEVERIELTHRAETRDVFATGALRAAKWLAGREPGLYTMADVLFG